MATYLTSIMPNVMIGLLYRGSTHGWHLKDFHLRCDSKGPTLTLIKIEDGDCIGGYTRGSWYSDRNKYDGDSASILFNLNQWRYFPSKLQANNIFTGRYIGPCFSGSGTEGELTLIEAPFNGYGNCRSLTNKPGYFVPSIKGINQLTNSKNPYVTVAELEVWLV